MKKLLGEGVIDLEGMCRAMREVSARLTPAVRRPIL